MHYVIHSITEQHQLLSLPGPEPPLVSVIKFEDIQYIPVNGTVHFSTDFYTIAIKKGCECKFRYGQHYYDHDQGVMSFIAPGQMLSWDADDTPPPAGWLLVMHPDFIRGHALEQKIKEYGFFNYAADEALHLSPGEEKMMETIMENIKQEYCSIIDSYSQDVIISQIELLLTYSNRFYKRQFTTRKAVNAQLLEKLEAVFEQYFKEALPLQKGLPTVTYLAESLSMSPSYLSDMLRSLIGQNATQFIHAKLIEYAKEQLSGTGLSVNEIAYSLGFEHAQSFSKLFKNKTKLTPLEFRRSFN